jgi:hypothetical protein
VGVLFGQQKHFGLAGEGSGDGDHLLFTTAQLATFAVTNLSSSGKVAKRSSIDQRFSVAA